MVAGWVGLNSQLGLGRSARLPPCRVSKEHSPVLPHWKSRVRVWRRHLITMVVRLKAEYIWVVLWTGTQFRVTSERWAVGSGRATRSTIREMGRQDYTSSGRHGGPRLPVSSWIYSQAKNTFENQGETLHCIYSFGELEAWLRALLQPIENWKSLNLMFWKDMVWIII